MKHQMIWGLGTGFIWKVVFDSAGTEKLRKLRTSNLPFLACKQSSVVVSCQYFELDSFSECCNACFTLCRDFWVSRKVLLMSFVFLFVCVFSSNLPQEQANHILIFNFIFSFKTWKFLLCNECLVQMKTYFRALVTTQDGWGEVYTLWYEGEWASIIGY